MEKIKTKIIVHSHSLGSEAHEKIIADKITVGRHSESDIQIKDMSVSRRHFNLINKEGKLHVEDLNASNPTKIDGIELKPGEIYELGEKAVISCGNVRMNIEWENPNQIKSDVDEENYEDRQAPEIKYVLKNESKGYPEKGIKKKQKEENGDEPVGDKFLASIFGTNDEMGDADQINQSEDGIEVSGKETKFCLHCMTHIDISEKYCKKCGWVEGTPQKIDFHLKPGTLLNNGRYLVGTSISFGGFGIIYIAYDYKMKTKIAIKEYYPSNQDNPVSRVSGENEIVIPTSIDEREIFEKGKQRFIEEAINLAKFGDIDSIVDVHEWFEDNNTVYMVMEHLEGRGLNEYLKELSRAIPYAEAVPIVVPIIEALEEVHKRGMLHRDISPDNIFMCNDGNIKLIDFGAARYSKTDEAKSEIVKIGYTPIEQYSETGKQGPWTDVYAMAATFYTMVTGTKPQESTARVKEDFVELPSEMGIKIPKNIENAIMRGLALEQKLRIKSMKDFLESLNQDKPLRLPENERRFRRLRGIISAVSAIILVTAGILLYLLVLRPTPLMDGVLAETEITTWSLESERSSINIIKDVFNENYPQVSFDVTYHDENEYEAIFNEAMTQDQLPVLYNGDMLMNFNPDAELTQGLDEILETLDGEKYLIAELLEKNIIDNKSIPLGFDLKVLFWNTNLVSSSIIEYEIDDVLEFDEYTDNVTKLIAMEPEMYDVLLGSFGLDINARNGDITEGEREKIEKVVKLINEEKVMVGENAYQDFISEKALFYIGYASQMRQLINEDMSGHCNVGALISTDSPVIYARLSSLYHVNAKKSDEEKEAAMTFLGNAVGEYNQNLLSIQESVFLPINRTVLAKFKEIYRMPELLFEHQHSFENEKYKREVKIVDNSLESLENMILKTNTFVHQQ